MINETRLRALYPRAPNDHIKAFAASSAPAQHGITAEPNRIAFFLAQLGHESGGLTIREENLNYSVANINNTFSRRIPPSEAAAYAKQPRKLANKVYGDRMGNRPGTDDGYNYRGRGYIQITGRDGYDQVGKRAGLDLVANPELAYQPGTAVTVACAFWTWKVLNPVCDQNDFRRCTKLINGGYNGLPDREKWLARTRKILSSETPPVSVAVEQTKGRVAATSAAAAGTATTATVQAPKPAPAAPSSTPWMAVGIAVAAAVLIAVFIIHKHKQIASTWGAPVIPKEATS